LGTGPFLENHSSSGFPHKSIRSRQAKKSLTLSAKNRQVKCSSPGNVICRLLFRAAFDRHFRNQNPKIGVQSLNRVGVDSAGFFAIRLFHLQSTCRFTGNGRRRSFRNYWKLAGPSIDWFPIHRRSSVIWQKSWNIAVVWKVVTIQIAGSLRWQSAIISPGSWCFMSFSNSAVLSSLIGSKKVIVDQWYCQASCFLKRRVILLLGAAFKSTIYHPLWWRLPIISSRILKGWSWVLSHIPAKYIVIQSKAQFDPDHLDCYCELRIFSRPVIVCCRRIQTCLECVKLCFPNCQIIWTWRFPKNLWGPAWNAFDRICSSATSWRITRFEFSIMASLSFGRGDCARLPENLLTRMAKTGFLHRGVYLNLWTKKLIWIIE